MKSTQDVTSELDSMMPKHALTSSSDTVPASKRPHQHQPQQQRELVQEIRLTEQEQKLFVFLLDVEKQYQCQAVLRVAGGWVRDKLLGRDSDDVDIVLDCMKGRAFADLINSYEADHGHQPHAVGVIKANPEQSKHLETATMHLGEIGWVDFVNLRAETYSDEHRIPEVDFGTPVQDAERRDFTINSMFYNIAERTVEDFTQRGMDDLRDGILRTPLDPRVTFLDDPLRILRAVRFASRFNLVMEESMRAAIELGDVKEALIKKVSRERVGKELVGMLTGSSAHPERALRLLYELQLCRCIFLPPQKLPVLQGDGTPHDVTHEQALWDRGYKYAAEMYNLMVRQTGLDELLVDQLPEDEQTLLRVRVLSSFLLPFADYYVVEKKRQVLLPSFIVRESLKLRNRDAEDVGNVVLRNVKALQELTQSKQFDRTRTGLQLREIGALWELCRDVALVQELVHNGSESVTRDQISQRYTVFTSQVEEAGLVGVWDLKPLLNGNDLVKELGVKPGPAMRPMLDKIIIWQLENPLKTREDCMAHFKQL